MQTFLDALTAAVAAGLKADVRGLPGEWEVGYVGLTPPPCGASYGCYKVAVQLKRIAPPPPPEPEPVVEAVAEGAES